jgi:hypothetical protein
MIAERLGQLARTMLNTVSRMWASGTSATPKFVILRLPHPRSKLVGPSTSVTCHGPSLSAAFVCYLCKSHVLATVMIC